MRFRTFINFFFCIAVGVTLCLSDDEVFISMAGDCRYPSVVTEGKSMFMTWIVAEGKQANLYFKKSNDEGKTWSSARKISNEKSDCLPPSTAVSSGVVHATWIDFGETVGGELYYARSPDGGDTWEKNYILFGNANNARYPLVTCRGNNVYVVWQDGENKIYLKASYDQGKTWKNETFIGKVGTHSCFCFPPAFSITRKELVIAWADFRQDNKGLSVKFSGIPLFKAQDKNVSILDRNTRMLSSIVCRTSTDEGKTWSKERILARCKVSKEMKDEIDNPVMISDSTLSYIFWLDRRNVEIGELYYARFDPGEKKGSLIGKNIFPTPRRSPKRPSVTSDKEGNLHLTWATFFGGQSIIHYGAINAAGNILEDKRNMTSVVGRYHNPVITRTASGILYLFWFNEPKDKEKWSTIFLKTSKDNGITWESWGTETEDMTK